AAADARGVARYRQPRAAGRACQDSASQRIPVDRMLPLIVSFPLRLPIRLAESPPSGINLATGRPCLVITIPSGPTPSSNARPCALNLAAGMVFAMPGNLPLDTKTVQCDQPARSGLQ